MTHLALRHDRDHRKDDQKTIKAAKNLIKSIVRFLFTNQYYASNCEISP